MPEPPHQWRIVYRDADYEVSLDTANIERGPEGSHLVWYQTRHTAERTEAGKRWNREVIRSLLRCRPLSFKTVHITLHYGDGPVVAQRGSDVAAVVDTPWKPTRFPSADEGAMSEACAVIERSGP